MSKRVLFCMLGLVLHTAITSVIAADRVNIDRVVVRNAALVAEEAFEKMVYNATLAGISQVSISGKIGFGVVTTNKESPDEAEMRILNARNIKLAATKAAEASARVIEAVDTAQPDRVIITLLQEMNLTIAEAKMLNGRQSPLSSASAEIGFVLAAAVKHCGEPDDSEKVPSRPGSGLARVLAGQQPEARQTK